MTLVACASTVPRMKTAEGPGGSPRPFGRARVAQGVRGHCFRRWASRSTRYFASSPLQFLMWITSPIRSLSYRLGCCQNRRVFSDQRQNSSTARSVSSVSYYGMTDSYSRDKEVEINSPAMPCDTLPSQIVSRSTETNNGVRLDPCRQVAASHT
jgi:hypothetical protein